jgi:hypothetical protein
MDSGVIGRHGLNVVVNVVAESKDVFERVQAHLRHMAADSALVSHWKRVDVTSTSVKVGRKYISNNLYIPSRTGASNLKVCCLMRVSIGFSLSKGMQSETLLFSAQNQSLLMALLVQWHA